MKISYSMAGMCVSAISIIFPTVAQAEDELKIKLGAHAFFDYENVEVGSATPVDGTNLRLFRVDAGGSYGDYKFTSNFDLQGEEIQIRDLFLEFGGDTKFRFGSFKVMNGLEQPSSLYATTFAEANSVTKVNGLGRKLGAAVFHSLDNVQLSGGIFSTDVNDTSDKDEWSVTGRVTTELHPGDKANQLHLGVSARYRENADMALYGYSHKPFAKSAPTTVKTPKLTDSDTFIGLETAFVRDGFSLQSEYGLAQAECDLSVCSTDPSFTSYYVDASYIWGGKRVLKKGLFGRTKIDRPASEGGKGAFQLAVRYDVADLNDGPVIGGRQESWVIGGTWYRDKYIRVMGNYSHSELEDSPSYGNSSADAFVIRLQAELY